MNYWIIGLILGSLVYYTYSGKNLISSSQAKDLLKQNKIDLVIDVRTPTEFSLGNYPGSINLPISDMTHERLNQLDKNKTYLVYCNTGQRARRAVEVMTQNGFKKVSYIAGTYLGLL
jgi:rhodanese-related sulfurtransferase